MEESKYPEADKLTYLYSWTDLLNLIEYMDSKDYIKVDAPKAPVEIVCDYLGIEDIEVGDVVNVHCDGSVMKEFLELLVDAQPIEFDDIRAGDTVAILVRDGHIRYGVAHCSDKELGRWLDDSGRFVALRGEYNYLLKSGGKALPGNVGDMVRVLEVGGHLFLEDEDVEFCVGDLIERTADGLWVNMGTRSRYTDEFVAAWGIVWEQVWITNEEPV